MVARVAIDLSLDRPFTYLVPKELEKKLAVGQLLSVPFGHRVAQGFVLELAEKCSDRAISYKLKPIAEILDETPFFTPALLKLVHNIADGTISPIESVLRAAVPAAVLKKNMKARELLYVDANAAADLAAMKARQKWIYDQLVRLGGGWMQSICTELKTTSATLRAMAQAGFVTIEPKARRRDPLAGRRILPTKPLKLNEEQAAALETIRSNQGKTILLQGVTGSGKTEVYLQAIAAELEAGRGAIVLVPEIALTPQTVQRFAGRFGDQIAVLHSALSDGERYDEWHRIRSGEARVVIGPRSAVFAPVKNLGLIVVDEEHETSYKQEETPRYHARGAAVRRGKIEGATVILGSATPSAESVALAKQGTFVWARIEHRAGAGTLPIIHLVDMTQEGEIKPIYSRDLLEAIHTRLDRHEQTILFLNRRGYSRSMDCGVCGEPVVCPECGIPYTYHQADNCLRCHICGGWIPPPLACPTCGHRGTFSYKGIGTQRAEDALKKCFPHARILRMDADSTSRKNSHDDILSAFRRGDADVLLGTQMIAKGLDFPNVTLVGVLNADSSLNMPDFRASERTYQLLAQVAGRAGRAELPGEVFIQTCNPSAPAIQAAAKGDFINFMENELSERSNAFFPPYSRLAVLRVRSQNPKEAEDWANMYAKSLIRFAERFSERHNNARLVASEAIPCVIEKADGWYRWQVIIRSDNANWITTAWVWVEKERPAPDTLKLSIDMDAYNLM